MVRGHDTGHWQGGILGSHQAEVVAVRVETKHAVMSTTFAFTDLVASQRTDAVESMANVRDRDVYMYGLLGRSLL